MCISCVSIGNREIVSKLAENGPSGALHRTNYREIEIRCRRMVNALIQTLNIRRGDVVATLAFNSNNTYTI